MSRRFSKDGPIPSYHPVNPNSPGHTPGMPWPIDPTAIGNDPAKIPHWTGEVQTVVWVPAANFAAAGYDNPAYGSTVNVFNRALITSPIFDLRPDLGGTYRPTATRIPGAARLHFAIWRNDGLFLADLASTLEAYTIERGALVDPTKARWMDERFDITTDFYQGTEQTILEWAPAGAPMRFWQVSIILDWMDNGNPPPALTTVGTAH